MKVTKFQYNTYLQTILAHNQQIVLVKNSKYIHFGRIDNIHITLFRQIYVQSTIPKSKFFFECSNITNNMIPVRLNSYLSNQIGMMNLNSGQIKQSIMSESSYDIIVPLENKGIDLAIVGRGRGRQKIFFYRRLKQIRIIKYELIQGFSIVDVKLNLDSVFMTVVNQNDEQNEQNDENEENEQNKQVFKGRVYKFDGFNSLGNGQRQMKNQTSQKAAQKIQNIYISPNGRFYILNYSLYSIDHQVLFKIQQYDHINFSNDSDYLIYVKRNILKFQRILDQNKYEIKIPQYKKKAQHYFQGLQVDNVNGSIVLWDSESIWMIENQKEYNAKIEYHTNQIISFKILIRNICSQNELTNDMIAQRGKSKIFRVVHQMLNVRKRWLYNYSTKTISEKLEEEREKKEEDGLQNLYMRRYNHLLDYNN